MRLVWWGWNIRQWRLQYLGRDRTDPDPRLIYDWVLQLGPVEIRKWRTAD